MHISKFFCMLIAGLAIIGFTTVGMAEQEEVKQGEDVEATKSEAAAEVESAAKVESEAESKEEIIYGSEPKSEEKEAKAEEKE